LAARAASTIFYVGILKDRREEGGRKNETPSLWIAYPHTTNLSRVSSYPTHPPMVIQAHGNPNLLCPAPYHLHAILIDLTADLLVPIKHVKDVAAPLPVDLVNRPQGLVFALPLVALIHLYVVTREREKVGREA